jgi:DNA-binding HxlR family transcriptional regulator
VEYSLTDLGLRLEPILKEMQKFGEEYKISDGL